MTEASLIVECELPFAWEAGTANPALRQGSLLLLKVVNQLEGTPRETEQDRHQERLETKLDLLLHWLGTLLFAAAAPLGPTPLRLDALGVEWPVEEGSAMVAGECILALELYPALAAPVRLAANAAQVRPGWWRAEFELMDEDLADQWTQWLFRRHRRAIQTERRDQAGSSRPG